MRKLLLPSLLTGFILSVSAPKVQAQSWTIDSISVPPVAYSCSSTVVTVHTYLGCINYSHVGDADSVTGFNIGLKITRTFSSICFGAITYPTHTFNLGFLPPGTYSITATGNYSGIGVAATGTKTLVVTDCCPNAAFDAEFDVNDTTICENDSVICTNTSSGSGVTYKWYLDGVYAANTTNFAAQLTTIGTHNIQLMADSATCKRINATDVEVMEIPTLNIGLDRYICVGEKATLNAGQGWDSLLWNTADTTQTVVVMDSGNYSLIARDTNHCKLHYDTLNVSFKPTPVVDFGNDTTLCEDEKLLLDASNPGATYIWQDNSIGAAYQVSLPGKYWVRAKFSNNCWTSDTINVDYTICTDIEEHGNTSARVLPNPFSDFITFGSMHGEFLKNVSIYNSSGARVYFAESIQATSSIDVSHLPSGVYVLYLQDEGALKSFKLVKKAD